MCALLIILAKVLQKVPRWMSAPKYHFKPEPQFRYQSEVFKKFNPCSFTTQVSLKIIDTKISSNFEGFLRLKGFYQQRVNLPAPLMCCQWGSGQMRKDELCSKIVKAFMEGKRHYTGTIAFNILFGVFSNFEAVLTLYPLSCISSALWDHTFTYSNTRYLCWRCWVLDKNQLGFATSTGTTFKHP